jgi:hypothetical protein
VQLKSATQRSVKSVDGEDGKSFEQFSRACNSSPSFRRLTFANFYFFPQIFCSISSRFGNIHHLLDLLFLSTIEQMQIGGITLFGYLVSRADASFLSGSIITCLPFLAVRILLVAFGADSKKLDQV